MVLSLAACGSGYTISEMPNTELSAGNTGGNSNTLMPPAGGCGTDTYANYAQAFVTQNCAQSCHPGLSPPDLTTQAAFVTSKADVVTHVTGTKDMPLGGTMADADRARFAAWVNCGAP